MKILVMGFSKLKYMPYLNFYIDNIDREKNDVHILYWNRDLKNEDIWGFSNTVLHEFRCLQEDYVAKKTKIASFLKYRRYVTKVIKKEKFDFIIVLTTSPGVLLSGVLTKGYKNRYVFDYRDSTYERYKFYRNVVHKIVRNSYATFISSDGFRQFLPDECGDKIFVSHNILSDSLLHRNEKKEFGIHSDKIRIAFWGQIREEKVNRALIKAFACDERFEVHFYGRDHQITFSLREYVKSLGADNIFFHGEYKPEDRYQFARKTDIIHNVFDTPNMMIAMGNKYYDGLIFRIPQICTKDSFMGECVKNVSVGLACDPYALDFASTVYEYYRNIDKEQLEKNCDAALENVMDEYAEGQRIIERISNMETEVRNNRKLSGGVLSKK